MESRIRKILAQRQRRILSSEGLIKAAVLIPLFESADEYHVVFTKRTETVEKHKGQICFPGGAVHGDNETPLQAALRESWEEIRLRPQDVEILGEFDDIETPTTGFRVTPFVGRIPHPYSFEISEEEVEEILEVPLSVFRDPRNYWEEIREYVGVSYPVSHFRYNDRVIWGATARMLKDFLSLIFEDVEPGSPFPTTCQYKID